MDFDLSADQLALRDAAATLLDHYADHDALRARVGGGVVVGTLPGAGTATSTAGDAPTGYDQSAWSAMADQGWLALEIPEEEGGLGLGMVEVAVLCEQIGRRLVAAPFLPSIVALGALSEPEARDQAATAPWRSALADGSATACLAHAATPGTLDVESRDNGVLLSGDAGPTVFAPSADIAVVITDEAVFAVDQQAHGRPAPLPAMDRTREIGTLTFASTPAVRIGDAPAAALVLDRAATACSAEMLGAADHVLAMTVGYAKDRVQFGKPIGSFQAVKHMLADALVDVEGMRSTAYYAAWCAAADDRERSLAASMAKAWCSDASRRVMAAGLQVHGGIGFTWEHDMHLYVKRAQLDQVSFGDSATHRDRIASILRERLDKGEDFS
ncbi:MAG TPA: acyl-CoA dehydrogenase family protein [Acidimicrobiales bacterium]|nr:acyl-CoA dehydrogenase family protein [Acidimicrobiales bacterium]